MSKRGDKEFILDMLIACKNILEYTKDMDFDRFSRSQMVIDAVMRNIEILGEATKNVSDKLKSKYPEIEWRKISGTRDRIIHFYFGIKLEIVWDIISTHIPNLKRQLENIIKKEGWGL
jgi:uncharacterized protein with HEPN domain